MSRVMLVIVVVLLIFYYAVGRLSANLDQAERTRAKQDVELFDYSAEGQPTMDAIQAPALPTPVTEPSVTPPITQESSFSYPAPEPQQPYPQAAEDEHNTIRDSYPLPQSTDYPLPEASATPFQQECDPAFNDCNPEGSRRSTDQDSSELPANESPSGFEDQQALSEGGQPSYPQDPGLEQSDYNQYQPPGAPNYPTPENTNEPNY